MRPVTSPTQLSVSGGATAVPTLEARARSGGWRILSALIQLGTMQFVVAVGTLVRNKAMAIYLKPEGFGEFTQLVAVTAPIYAFVQCGMAVGLSRNAAAAETSEERQRELETANTLTTVLALAAILLFIPLVLGGPSEWLLPALGIQPGLRQKAILAVLLAVAPLEALRNNFLTFLEGLLDVKGVSTKRSLAIVLSTAAAVPLIASLGIVGACVQTVFASLVLAVLLGLRCKRLGFSPLALRWRRSTALSLATLGSASVVIGFTQTSIDALIRAHLIATTGIGTNGLYQAAVSVSAFVTAIVLGSVGVYSLATLSQTVDSACRQARFEELVRVVLPVAAIGLGAVGLFCQPIFSVLFASQFSAGIRYLPLLLTANYVQVAVWVLGGPVLGSRLIRFWIGIQLIDLAIRYTAVRMLSPLLGAQAVPLALLFSMVFDIAGYGFVCGWILKLRVARRTGLAFIAGAGAVALAATAGSLGTSPAWIFSAGFSLCAVIAIMAWSDLRCLPDAVMRRCGLRG